MLKNVLAGVRGQVREAMLQGMGGDENARLRLVMKVNGKYSKEVKSETMRILREKHGIRGDIEDFTYRELDLFAQYAESVNDVYDEVGKAYGQMM
jgi:hypothetical protein